MVVEDTTVVMTVEAVEVITTTDNITETGIAMCKVRAIIVITITITTIIADIVTEIEMTTVLILAAIAVTTAVIMTMTTATLGNNKTATNEVAVARKGNRTHPPT